MQPFSCVYCAFFPLDMFLQKCNDLCADILNLHELYCFKFHTYICKYIYISFSTILKILCFKIHSCCCVFVWTPRVGSKKIMLSWASSCVPLMVCVNISLGYIHRSGMADSYKYGEFIWLNGARSLSEMAAPAFTPTTAQQDSLHKGFTILHSNRCEVIAINVHLFDCSASLHMLANL